MANGISQDGSDNIALQNIQESEINIAKIYDSKYEEWNKQLERERKYLNKLQGKSDRDEREKTLKEIRILESKIGEYENYAQQLLREANRTRGINSKRLNEARELIDKGEIEKARNFYKQNKEKILEEKHELAEKEEILSEELLISALLSQSDYKNPNRFRETWELFFLSIETKKTKQNHLHFGLFLYEHNEYEKAINCLELTFQTFFNELNLIELSSVLNGLGVLYRKVNKFEQGEIVLKDAVRILQDAYKFDKSEEILSAISLVKNGLATLYGVQWKYEQAIFEFEEAEKNWRKLNKKKGEYLELLSLTLNNYGNILKDIGKYKESGKKHTESLKIRRKLNKENPELFESVIVSSLSNLSNLETKLDNDDKALDYQLEAVNLNRKLAKTNPNKHLSHLAQSLVSLGNKYVYLGEYSSAEQSYLEAVQINNNSIFNLSPPRLFDLAHLSINLAEFYQRNIYKMETSIFCAIGAYVGVFSLARVNPEAMVILIRAAKVINSWNIDFVELFKVLELNISEQFIQSIFQSSHPNNTNSKKFFQSFLIRCG